MWLRGRKEPSTRAQAVARFKIKPAAASHALRRLVWRGSAKRIGSGKFSTYIATSLRPVDLRGTAVGSLKALTKYSGNPEHLPERSCTVS